jgi:Fe-S cluster biogenesis protein NfuA
MLARITNNLCSNVVHRLPQLSFASLGSYSILRRSLFVQVQDTPNPQSIKFVPTGLEPAGRQVLDPMQQPIEFAINDTLSRASPLARSLLRISGVKTVFFGSNFITVTKQEDAEWLALKADIFAAIIDHFSTGIPTIDTEKLRDIQSKEKKLSDTVESDESETVELIKTLIETRIRPTVQEDGGDIIFMAFEKGIVKLKLQGACTSCPSSIVTLRNGVQNMLQFYVGPEVLGVEQVEDEAERVSNQQLRQMEKQIEPSHAQ